MIKFCQILCCESSWFVRANVFVSELTWILMVLRMLIVSMIAELESKRISTSWLCRIQSSLRKSIKSLLVNNNKKKQTKQSFEHCTNIFNYQNLLLSLNRLIFPSLRPWPSPDIRDSSHVRQSSIQPMRT